jgi:hypothetical protein
MWDRNLTGLHPEWTWRIWYSLFLSLAFWFLVSGDVFVHHVDFRNGGRRHCGFMLTLCFPTRDWWRLTFIILLAIEWKVCETFYGDIFTDPSSLLPLSFINWTCVGGISSSFLVVLSAIMIAFLCGALPWTFHVTFDHQTVGAHPVYITFRFRSA